MQHEEQTATGLSLRRRHCPPPLRIRPHNFPTASPGDLESPDTMAFFRPKAQDISCERDCDYHMEQSRQMKAFGNRTQPKIQEIAETHSPTESNSPEASFRFPPPMLSSNQTPSPPYEISSTFQGRRTGRSVFDYQDEQDVGGSSTANEAEEEESKAEEGEEPSEPSGINLGVHSMWIEEGVLWNVGGELWVQIR